jgi:tryptophan synthase alpha chain
MSRFFAERRPGELGLAVFLNAGDPPFDVLKHVALLLDACRVDCLELAVPFPNSASDGPVIRRSARRALDQGVDLNAVLPFVETLRPQLSHLKVALLADWSHTVKGLPLRAFLREVKSAGVDGLLLHGLPPRTRAAYYETARLVGQPIVTTCYATSRSEVLDEAARHGSAYLYLVARYGRTGVSAPSDYRTLAPVIRGLRKRTVVPIAVGFGVRERAHLEGVRQAGADAAILGSAAVSCVEQAQATRRDVVEEVHTLLLRLGAIR